MIKKLMLVAVIAGSSVSSIASEQLWDFSGDRGFNNSSFGANQTISSGVGMNLTLDAWSSPGDGCSQVNQSTGVDACMASAALTNADSARIAPKANEGYRAPSYTNDNGMAYSQGNTDVDSDMVLLSFDDSLKVADVGNNWMWKDFDASVAAYNGANNANGFGQNSFLDQGWNLIDGKPTQPSSNRDFAVNDADMYSQHWLVGSFNSPFSNTSWSDTNDSFKSAGLTAYSKNGGQGTNVSAPATTGMLIALVAFMAYRRKNK